MSVPPIATLTGPRPVFVAAHQSQTSTTYNRLEWTKNFHGFSLGLLFDFISGTGGVRTQVAGGLFSGNVLDQGNNGGNLTSGLVAWVPEAAYQERSVTSDSYSAGGSGTSSLVRQSVYASIAGCDPNSSVVSDIAVTRSTSWSGTQAATGVTTTVDKSLVLFVFHAGNDALGMDIDDFSPTPDYFTQGETTLATDGTYFVLGYYDVPAGVTISPEFTPLGTNTVGWMAQGVVIDPLVGDVPFVVPGSLIYQDYGSTYQSSAIPANLPTSDVPWEYGDILVLAFSDRLRPGSSIHNTDDWDHVTDGDGVPMAFVRITSAAQLDALAADAPTFQNSSSPVYGRGCSYLLRGIQATGDYWDTVSFLNHGSIAGASTLAITTAEDDETLVVHYQLDDDSLLQLHSTSGGDTYPPMVLTETDSSAHSLGGAITKAATAGANGQIWTWSGSEGGSWTQAALITAKPIHRVESSTSAAATLSTVLTAETGAQFIESSVVATAQVDTTLSRRMLTMRKYSRPLVWIHGLDQVRKNVLD